MAFIKTCTTSTGRCTRTYTWVHCVPAVLHWSNQGSNTSDLKPTSVTMTSASGRWHANCTAPEITINKNSVMMTARSCRRHECRTEHHDPPRSALRHVTPTTDSPEDDARTKKLPAFRKTITKNSWRLRSDISDRWVRQIDCYATLLLAHPRKILVQLFLNRNILSRSKIGLTWKLQIAWGTLSQ